MALTDSNDSGTAFDPARALELSLPQRAPIPHDALAQLPRLRHEAGRNIRLSLFLARSPQACVILMLTGATILLAGGGGTLKGDFAWAALVLIGIIAMTRNYIRGFARSLRRVPLQEAAADLRVQLLYTGAAWGSGAFLVMPDLPAPALAISFAALPSLGLALTLKDRKGIMAFGVTVTVLTAGAALLGAWPMALWVAGAITAAGVATVIFPALQHERRKRVTAPAPP